MISSPICFLCVNDGGVVNNVGINIRKKSEEYSSEEFNLIMGTNLESAFSMSQLCFPLLRQSGR